MTDLSRQKFFLEHDKLIRPLGGPTTLLIYPLDLLISVENVDPCSGMFSHTFGNCFSVISDVFLCFYMENI